MQLNRYFSHVFGPLEAIPSLAENTLIYEVCADKLLLPPVRTWLTVEMVGL